MSVGALPIFALIVPIAALAAVASFVLFIVMWALNYSKEKSKISLICFIAAMVAFVLDAAAFVLNFGWIRFVLVFSGIPFVHFFIVYLINIFAIRFVSRSRALAAINLITLAVFAITYAFMPDVSDDIGNYYFFTLLTDTNGIPWLIFANLILVQFALLITEIIMMIVLKVNSTKPAVIIGTEADNTEYNEFNF
ncbi:MAG: hypothetical protein IJO52_06205 [Clostridia bacterium]|nr:hypothetical protein [Clostridia bacterium]